MKIFIQGRKDGYNTLYPKPTPTEFFQFASDIQRIDAQNNAQNYGKSLYAIAFNGNGCIFTKYIIGYDTLRSNIGNIGISVFIPINQKMLGADIKTLLDELIKIYTSNYCPDFKINNQKQEDWLLFSSFANIYDAKVKIISSDENFQYGNKDAAYIIYDNVAEIEKYLETPYQEEYKEYKQVLLVDNQEKLLLEVIKHDQTANLTGKIDLENPSYKLSEYHGQGKNGVSIEIRANGKLRNNKDKVFKKDIISIRYSKKYYNDIFEEGKIFEPQINQYLSIYDTSIVIKKDVDLIPTEKTINVIINDSKGNTINDVIINCKSNILKAEKQVENNKIVFKGEEQKEQWIISAKKDSFSGEIKVTPENESTAKLVIREAKIVKLEIFDEKGKLMPNKSKDLTFYDDNVYKEHTEIVNIQGYQTKKILFFPNNEEVINVQLTKQKNEPKPPVPIPPHTQKPYIIIALGILMICLLVMGSYFLIDTYWIGDKSDIVQENTQQIQSKQFSEEEIEKFKKEIENYVEGDSLFLEKLNQFKTDWVKLTINIDTSLDSKKYKDLKIFEVWLDKAINKRVAINEGNFEFFNDSNNKVNFSDAQQPFKSALNKISKDKYTNVKSKLGDVSTLTLTQITEKVNNIISSQTNATSERTKTNSTQPTKEKENENENGNQNSTKTNNSKIKQEEQNTNESSIEKEIINYLKGNELKVDKLNNYINKAISIKLKKSIELALEFWTLDGSTLNKKNTYYSFKNKLQKDPNFKSSELLKFLERDNTKTKYPKEIPGAGKTKTLSKFIEEATK